MSDDGADAPWVVKFLPYPSFVESSFWVEYCQEKLDKIKLSEEAVSLSASIGERLECRSNALLGPSSNSNSHPDRVMIGGKLVGYNTIETFQQKDKNELLKEEFLPEFGERPASLTSFVLLTFADLKAHKVLYWFAVPAIAPKAGCAIRATKQQELQNVLTESHLQGMYDSFLANVWTEPALDAYFLYSPTSGCQPFSKDVYTKLCNQDGSERVMFGFVDSTNSAADAPGGVMGWSMRNLVAFLSLKWNLGGKTVQILSFRNKVLRKASFDFKNDVSILLHVNVPTQEDYGDDNNSIKVVGWELNARGKPGPRWVNLRPLLDNTHLAIQAADLNLKLMKWRMLPSLDIDRLSNLKVLLLGAGTLGCNVARTLLGWGIRKFTIVDNGKVSFSNPVRQSLFTLDDCTGGEGGSGGRHKAVAAAQALETIVADAEAQGIVLSIPMPGHSEEDETIRTTVEQLDQLVQDADVVFLLTDTRESRWLPTVMAAAHDKMLINAALGLDSWLVMRHGGDTSLSTSEDEGTTTTMGCYFCNDVVAPENSMKNRTLDQQCTVTRPGLAPVASSMAVELMVSLLHHPKLHRAPAPKQMSTFSPTVSSSDEASPLGVMPHQVRGSLVSYTMMTPTVPSFSCCTGCSPLVVKEYRKDPVALMTRVAHAGGTKALEDLSGLTAFRADAISKLEDLEEDWDDDDEM